MASDDDLAKAWLRYQQAADAADFWAVEDLLELAHADPRRCWHTILLVGEAAAAHPESEAVVLAVLAAGPMEEMMAMHGRVLIDDLETAADRHRFVRKLAAGMYRHGIEADVWSRILRLRES